MVVPDLIQVMIDPNMEVDQPYRHVNYISDLVGSVISLTGICTEIFSNGMWIKFNMGRQINKQECLSVEGHNEILHTAYDET